MPSWGYYIPRDMLSLSMSSAESTGLPPPMLPPIGMFYNLNRSKFVSRSSRTSLLVSNTTSIYYSLPQLLQKHQCSASCTYINTTYAFSARRRQHTIRDYHTILQYNTTIQYYNTKWLYILQHKITIQYYNTKLQYNTTTQYYNNKQLQHHMPNFNPAKVCRASHAPPTSTTNHLPYNTTLY